MVETKDIKCQEKRKLVKTWDSQEAEAALREMGWSKTSPQVGAKATQCLGRVLPSAELRGLWGNYFHFLCQIRKS